MKASHKKQTRIRFKGSHPAFGTDNIFDSWMTLCEFVCERARQVVLQEEEARIEALADAMKDSVEELPPED